MASVSSTLYSLPPNGRPSTVTLRAGNGDCEVGKGGVADILDLLFASPVVWLASLGRLEEVEASDEDSDTIGGSSFGSFSSDIVGGEIS